MADTRRTFVKAAAAAGLSVSATQLAAAGSIPKRKLGKTGLEVTIVGLGGARTGNLTDYQKAIDTIRRCFDLGVNYFDTAAAGAYGVSQSRYGDTLRSVRDKLYFATKTRHRTRLHARLDLEQSLNNLKTDYIDLYQVHNVMNDEDIEFIFGPRGLMEMIEQAKKEGKIRFVGLTGHTDPRVLVTAMKRYDFDTVLMPLSVTDGARPDMSFEKLTLPLALEKNMGVVAMKTLGAGGLLQENVAPVEESLRYVWSLPVSTAILGCSTIAEAETDARLASAFQPFSRTELSQVRQRYSRVDFAKLEPWKVDQSPKVARLRYPGE